MLFPVLVSALMCNSSLYMQLSLFLVYHKVHKTSISQPPAGAFYKLALLTFPLFVCVQGVEGAVDTSKVREERVL